MHRISTTSVGLNQSEGVIFLEQTPASFVFITAADTDIQTLAAAVPQLPAKFPALRVANLLLLQQQISIDTYSEQVLELAQVIILRLIGGRSYWPYGLEVLQEIAQRNGINLIVMPGDDALDPELFSQSTLPVATVNQIWQYFHEGGVENFVNALQFISDKCLATAYNPAPPRRVPRVGLYTEGRRQEAGGRRQRAGGRRQGELEKDDSQLPTPNSQLPKVGILFYRAHYLAGNTKVIDALCAALYRRNLQPVPVFVSSLRDPDVQTELMEFFQPQDSEQVAVLLNTTSFSLARLDTESPQTDLWEKLDIPVLQVILSGGFLEQWSTQSQGLSPRDIAMNVALPEVDGRIISRAVSFKTVQTRNPDLETDVVVYEPVSDRIEFVAQLAANWVKLRHKPPQERKIALILANYPNRDGRLANGVGLDTPASCIEILKALQQSGYAVENPPTNSDELIARLTSGVTNDPEGRDWRPVQQSLSTAEYQAYFASLPTAVQQGIRERWGIGDWEEESNCTSSLTNAPYPIPGIQLGNVFVGIQPSRGYDIDPSLNYHAPDLEPTHNYLAFYYWVRECFGADAIVHVGKHGNLEWLPGKSLALSNTCYPEVVFGAMPHLYPFIVNDPGEGSQAKRRAQAVIIDHLTPPMTRAELYGALQKLENLIDEYYEAESLDPARLPTLRDRIRELVIQENLYKDLGIQDEQEILNFAKSGSSGVSPIEQTFQDGLLILNSIDGYLCELKEAQIRDGLHIFGQCPQGRQLRDLIVAIARIPNRYSPGITRVLADAWGLEIDPLTVDFSTELSLNDKQILARKTSHPCHTAGDAVTTLEEHAALLVEQLMRQGGRGAGGAFFPNPQSSIPHILDWISTKLLPALQQTQMEITHLLRGLDGKYVPSAPSGAPTRGRPEVLPTGRNFYAVDIRAIPTETAWDVGRKAAENLIECYTQEHGEYPKTLGLSVWGTATMRTGGDDIAEALALLGVRPVWDGAARRVIDLEILPLSILGRPRVDVTLRISGFFRDAFPNLIDLFEQAVNAVAALDEPPEQNPLATQVKQDTEFWLQQGLTLEIAVARSQYRIFGSKPGAYGAGLQGLMASQNWQDDQDLAEAYINWSCYAYSSGHRLQVTGDSGVGEQGSQCVAEVPSVVATGVSRGAEEQGSRGAGEQRSRGAEENNDNHAQCPMPHAQSPVPNPQSPIPAPEAFTQRLAQMQVVLHNQDNREHDLLDSDDYYQFQGGLTAAVRSIQGKNPETYFGDNSIPSQPRVRQLKTEIARVYRSRVVNPKWIEGMMRHGYKGAFEMSATVDFLFAYDATARCVENYMYQGVMQAYLLDPVVCDFIQDKNPHALRDIAEKLLEAHKRGLWQDVNIQTLENLRNLVHQAEAAIEEK